MADIALFPVPLVQDSDLLADQNISYMANELSFGLDSVNNILTVEDSSLSNCMQRALKILLTDKGSVPSQINHGTALSSLVKYGYNPESINEDVVMILLDAEAQAKRQDIEAGLPAKARLSSLELIDLVLLPSGQLKLSIGIKNAQGLSGRFDLQV